MTRQPFLYTRTFPHPLAGTFLILAIYILAVAFMIVLSSCHTNNLAKYPLRGQHALFRSYVTSEGRAEAVIFGPGHGIASAIFAGISSEAVEREVEQKIQRAAQPDTMAQAVSDGLEEALHDYLGMMSLPQMSSDVEYIVETNLTDYALISNAEGVHARIGVACRIVSHANGAIVWENSEHADIPLRQSVEIWVPNRVARTTTAIINASMLAQLSEPAIAYLLDRASHEAGHQIADELRADASELPISDTMNLQHPTP